MSEENRLFDAWLSSAEIPYIWLLPLLLRMKSSFAVYTEFNKDKNLLRDLIPDAYIRKLQVLSDPAQMNRMQLLLSSCDIHSITILDDDYPHSLREISDPPGILFYRGNPDCLHRNRIVAMIGSRSASYNGQKAARRIARGLSTHQVVIVSGLAYGIDTASHQGCLEGSAPTIAVMGCGLEQNYPLRNEPLKNEILSHNGLLLSEYPPGVKPNGFRFPYRNRIISGLSDAVVLIEARIRSGSMTTVDHALRQGKEVFAYPGDPESQLSEGNRSLLRDGARYFTEAEDILADMNWLDNLSLVRHNSECSSRFIPANAAEDAVYKALIPGLLSFDELSLATKLDASELMSTLTVLQIKKVIEPIPGKKYQIVQE